MQSDRELMQQAYAVPLHEQLASVPVDARLVIDDQDGRGTRFIPVGRMCHEAATTLRERLAQQEQQAPRSDYRDWDYQNQLDAQEPVQEPVAWHHPECKGECVACLIQRAVQDEYGTQGLDYLLRHVTPVSTPPRREWVSVNEAEIKALPQWFPSHETAAAMPLIRAIEAKLKERNT